MTHPSTRFESLRRPPLKKFAALILVGILVFAGLQLIRPTIPSKPAAAEIQAPAEVVAVLDKDCYSCHSDEKRLAWFDQVVPAYWLVTHDILAAREHLNFSTIGAKPAAAQKATLFEAVNMIQLGAMPLPDFVQLHPEARVTPAGLALVTWHQRDDPHWFGARIPDTPVSVEFAAIAAAGTPATYRIFNGASLAEDHPEPQKSAMRTAFLTSLAPAQLP
jgi:hypothetical protein